ncbi:MAG: 16S rRNA (cytidine(1402)-2'-O)-methyltransferase, partial [Clostridia bacterium]|nr:16S rRNA (cytidine(1402)-2'-O)-methyltransferase [Clostridia bacterium]
MTGKLFVVGTPIGNLGDISPRALDTLESVDFIAAEDTRVTLKLLNHFEIKKPLISYFEHNKAEKGPQITDKILAGENCALVTDAGMPAISDPGEDIVRLCIESGIPVESVPGPCAFTTALAVSGMPSGRFVFEGFPPAGKKERAELFEELKKEKRTIILYEAPHKLSKTLAELAQALGARETAIVRELTKIHEQVIKTDLVSAAEKYGDNQLRGEIVLIIAGAPDEGGENMTAEQAAGYALSLIGEGMSKSDAAKL